MDNRVERLTFARLLRDSALELLLTLFMLFGVTSIIRWVIGPAPISRMIPQIHAELLIVGASVGILITGLILSPLGRITGGHMNPAISFAMWRFGVFPGAGVVPYIVAQLLGSVLGVVAACAVWGPVVAEPSVAYAVLQPGPGWSTIVTFRSGNVKYGGHRSSGRGFSGRAQARAIRPLDRGRSDRNGDRNARYLYGRQCESGSPIWTGCPFGTDPLPLGVSARTNGGRDARDVAPTNRPTPPVCPDTQTMWDSPRRQLVVGFNV